MSEFHAKNPWTPDLAAAALYRHLVRHGQITAIELNSYYGLPDRSTLRRMGYTNMTAIRRLAESYTEMVAA